jgi:hypothetical protein
VKDACGPRAASVRAQLACVGVSLIVSVSVVACARASAFQVAAGRVSGSPSVGGPVAAGASAGPLSACVHDAIAESQVIEAIDGMMAQGLTDMHRRLHVAFDCQPRAGRREILALATHGHRGALRLLDVSIDDRNIAAVRGVQMKPGVPSVSSTPDVAFGQVSVGREEDASVVRFVWAALSAHVTTEAVKEVDPAHHGFAISASDQDEDLEFQLCDAARPPAARSWDGYRSTLNDAERVPLELAWGRLWVLLDGHLAVGSAVEADRRMFSRFWPADRARRSWVFNELLELAATLGTPDMARAIARELDAEDEDVRILAVNALAAITRDDLRRSASGAPRPLEAIVSDYSSRFGQRPTP